MFAAVARWFDAPITTYLEGEILDFNTHTLLTESFKSSPSIDATYWRKLPPFQMLTDEEMIQKLPRDLQISSKLSSSAYVLVGMIKNEFAIAYNGPNATQHAMHTHVSLFCIDSKDPMVLPRWEPLFSDVS